MTLTGAALAQAPESVTVTGRRDAVAAFIKSATVPTHMTGKLARWETSICPAVQGIKPEDADALIARLKDVARQAGVAVNSRRDCDPNIEIAFTDQPQGAIDQIKESQPDLLGYHTSSEERDRLATVTRPIQGWYRTATRDLRGQVNMDDGLQRGKGLTIILPCVFTTEGSVATPSLGGSVRAQNSMRAAPKMCARQMPNAIKANITGSKIRDGLRSSFEHVIILVDTNEMAAQQAQGVNDHVALLALAQIAPQAGCLSLPSIANMLRPCGQPVPGLTVSDAAFLKALYHMNANLLVQGQKNHLAEQIEMALDKP